MFGLGHTADDLARIDSALAELGLATSPAMSDAKPNASVIVCRIGPAVSSGLVVHPPETSDDAQRAELIGSTEGEAGVAVVADDERAREWVTRVRISPRDHPPPGALARLMQTPALRTDAAISLSDDGACILGHSDTDLDAMALARLLRKSANRAGFAVTVSIERPAGDQSDGVSPSILGATAPLTTHRRSALPTVLVFLGLWVVLLALPHDHRDILGTAGVALVVTVTGRVFLTVTGRVFLRDSQTNRRGASAQRPLASNVPGAKRRRDTSGTEAAIIGVGALFAFLWKLVIFVLVVGAIAGFIWGGSNDAHLRCLDHRLGAPGLIDSLACVFEH
jgi:hypothetical protein